MSKIARKHRKPEFRTLPSDVKGLEEKRTALIEEMGDMVNKAEAETRTLSEEENKRFGEIRTEILIMLPYLFAFKFSTKIAIFQ